jgi:hypothetical protein
MDFEFKTVFNAIGWQSFWHVDDKGSKLSPIEFLCSLQVSRDEVYIHMFNQEYHLTWSELSIALGFDANCSLNLEHDTHRFNKLEFEKQ